MREILFRGEQVDNGEWVYGYYVKATYHWHEHGIHEDFIVVSASQNGGWFTIGQRFAVIPETVGQFTGLTDKNGTKIFEGDILKANLDDLFPNHISYAKVIWKDCSWYLEEFGYGENYQPDILEPQIAEYRKVAGNIYDNDLENFIEEITK